LKCSGKRGNIKNNMNAGCMKEVKKCNKKNLLYQFKAPSSIPKELTIMSKITRVKLLI
jgi:hypothetical protein